MNAVRTFPCLCPVASRERGALPEHRRPRLKGVGGRGGGDSPRADTNSAITGRRQYCCNWGERLSVYMQHTSIASALTPAAKVMLVGSAAVCQALVVTPCIRNRDVRHHSPSSRRRLNDRRRTKFQIFEISPLIVLLRFFLGGWGDAQPPIPYSSVLPMAKIMVCSLRLEFPPVVQASLARSEIMLPVWLKAIATLRPCTYM